MVTDHGDLDQKAYRTRPHLLATLIGTHCYYWEPDESSQSVFVSLGPSAELGCNQWLLRFLLHFYSPTNKSDHSHLNFIAALDPQHNNFLQHSIVAVCEIHFLMTYYILNPSNVAFNTSVCLNAFSGCHMIC